MPEVISVETISFELSGRFEQLGLETKNHLSVRWEPLPAIVRIGLMIADYNWDNRMRVLSMLTEFEAAHADEFAVEYDIVPLEPVKDDSFAEA